MFSNISEAWNNDPVKEMSNRLSKGSFTTNTDRNKIFDFRKKEEKKRSNYQLSDPNSLSLFSNGNHSGSDSEFDISSDLSIDQHSLLNQKENSLYSIPYAPVNFTRSKTNHRQNDTDTIVDSRCNYSIKHLEKCDRCYDKLKKLINTRVNRKFDELMLDSKLKQLQNIPLSTQMFQPNNHSDSWKETLIIVIGAIIAIFIIFLIVKALNK